MTPVARWALAAYPPSFRDRYGAELEALVEDVPPSWRHTTGLYAGAARAWARPAFTGPDSVRGRMQASVSTVWVAWCAGFLLVPAMDKALLDPPGPHADATVRRLLDAAAGVLVVGWLVVLIVGALLVSRSLLPALRERRWSVLRPLVPAVVLTAVETAGLVALVAASRSDAPHPSPATVVLALAWVVGLLALLASGGFGAGATIRLLHPSATALRLPTLLSAALAVCLAALTVTGAAAVLLARDAALVGSAVPVVAIVAVAAVASSTAVVSSARGVLALRRS
jgi:hypothetical protein